MRENTVGQKTSHHAFSRLETDAEFRARLPGKLPTDANEADLDDLAWSSFKMQRKIVTDAA